MSPKKLAIAVFLTVAAACFPKVTGAPCESDENCPNGQYCSTAGTCLTVGTPDPGGGGGPGDAGPSDGGQPDGGGCLDSTGNPADLQNDAKNCGQCGKVCPEPQNAAARCRAGACGRGPCSAGYFDIDGATTFGCESTCVGRVCTGNGNTVTLTNWPLPETGFVAREVAGGTSFGAKVQTSSSHTNFGVVGMVTPAADGGLEVRNSQYRHRGGFGSLAR